MLEELQTLALVGLLVSTYYLTIGCRNISESLPHESGYISDKVEGVTTKVSGMTEVLDDIANLLNEGLNALGGTAPSQTPSSPVEMILASLMSGMTSKPTHGNTQQTEREILEIDPTPTLETED